MSYNQFLTIQIYIQNISKQSEPIVFTSKSDLKGYNNILILLKQSPHCRRFENQYLNHTI